MLLQPIIASIPKTSSIDSAVWTQFTKLAYIKNET